jgi:hypothetical protein
MVVVSRAVWVLALGGTALVACGSRSELYALGGYYGTGTPPPGDDAAADDSGPDARGTCMGQPIEVTLNAPNLYFVLDHSTSMTEMNKWANVRQVVAQLITQIGAGARFGATMFPGTNAVNACDVGTQVMALQQGDAQGNLAATFLAATAATPLGGTPTAATLRSLGPTLSGLAGTTFAILATDGGPNCNASITSCSIADCTANVDMVGTCLPNGDVNCCQLPDGTTLSCLDETDTVNAAAGLASAGVKVFVLGIPGSAAYSAVLDQVAMAGGTARASEPYYYRVDTADDAALAASFAQIVAQTGAGCTFSLATPPTILEGARVVLAGVAVAESATDGWSLAGTTLTLSGTSCNEVKTSGAPSLQFFDGCRG